MIVTLYNLVVYTAVRLYRTFDASLFFHIFNMLRLFPVETINVILRSMHKTINTKLPDIGQMLHLATLFSLLILTFVIGPKKRGRRD